MTNALQENGFENKLEYLEYLADEYGVSLSTVVTIAEFMGDSELFDGVVSMVQDAADMGL